jgi:hypothetical protein
MKTLSFWVAGLLACFLGLSYAQLSAQPVPDNAEKSVYKLYNICASSPFFRTSIWNISPMGGG